MRTTTRPSALCVAWPSEGRIYLHVGSDAGGDTAAVIYTLLGTAKLSGINPQRYLCHVLDRIADHPSNRIDELLPWVVAAQWQDDEVSDMPLAP